MPPNFQQVKNALVPYKSYPLVPFKPAFSPVNIQHSQQKQLRHLPKDFNERLIKIARAVRIVSFGTRAVFAVIAGVGILYIKSKAEEAPEIVKDFCYQEAGRRNFKIKIEEGSGTSFNTWGNTLYVPKGLVWKCEYEGLDYVLKKRILLENERKIYNDAELHQKKLANESRIKYERERVETIKDAYVRAWHERELSDLEWENELDLTYFIAKKCQIERELVEYTARINLFKGIIDHELGHLNHYDCYRLPLMLGGTIVGMEYLWSKIRPRLESNFKQPTLGSSSTVRNVVHIGGRWVTRLIVPTVIYTCTFFASRQLLKKTIEAQADANVRDDLDVLTEMEKFFRQEAKYSMKHSVIRKTMDGFFDSHPSHESRANYFAQRIDNLKKSRSLSP